MLFDVSIGNDTPFFLLFFSVFRFFQVCVCVPPPGRLSLSIEHPLVCIRICVCVSFLNIHPVTNTEPQKVNILSIYELCTEICMMFVLSFVFPPPNDFSNRLSHATHIALNINRPSSSLITRNRVRSSLSSSHTHRTRACTYTHNSQKYSQNRSRSYKTYN